MVPSIKIPLTPTSKPSSGMQRDGIGRHTGKTHSFPHFHSNTVTDTAFLLYAPGKLHCCMNRLCGSHISPNTKDNIVSRLQLTANPTHILSNECILSERKPHVYSSRLLFCKLHTWYLPYAFKVSLFNSLQLNYFVVEKLLCCRFAPLSIYFTVFLNHSRSQL